MLQWHIDIVWPGNTLMVISMIAMTAISTTATIMFFVSSSIAATALRHENGKTAGQYNQQDPKKH